MLSLEFGIIRSELDGPSYYDGRADFSRRRPGAFEVGPGWRSPRATATPDRPSEAQILIKDWVVLLRAAARRGIIRGGQAGPSGGRPDGASARRLARGGWANGP